MGGHIADRLIGDDRDATAAEAAHVATCVDCFARAQRRRPFIVHLTAAARGLVVEPLPREVLLVDRPRTESSSRWSPGGAIVGLILVAVVGLGAYLAIPKAITPAGGSPSPSQDPHVVEVGGVRYEIKQRGQSIEVTSSAGGGNASLASEPSPDGGSTGYAMTCPSANGGPSIRFIFGHITPDPRATEPAVYDGPAAVGQAAPDGLFLFVITESPIDPAVMLEVKSRSGEIGVPGSIFADLEAQRGPLGCHVSG
jgi:hypothetical protein